MSTHTSQLAVVQAKPLTVHDGLTEEQVRLIKDIIGKECTDDELQLFLYTAKRTGLDPLVKQIYAVKRWNQSLGRKVMTIQTGIDGYRVVAQRNGLAGISDAVYDDETGTHPNKATVTVKKMVNGTICEFTASARWDEYKQTDKDGNLTSFWRKMPYLMLAKVAEALALRKAFPNDLAGIYTTEEMQQATYGPPEGKTESESVAEFEKRPENARVIEKAEGWINISGRVEKVGESKGLLFFELNGVTIFGDPTKSQMDELNQVRVGYELDCSCAKEATGTRKKAHEIMQVNLVLAPTIEAKTELEGQLEASIAAVAAKKTLATDEDVPF